jgi:hypothetical protein
VIPQTNLHHKGIALLIELKLSFTFLLYAFVNE